MTSIATVTGAMPLVFASGAGSASRGAIGVVVVAGVLLSTFLALFVIPAFYLLLARHTRPPEERGRKLDELDRAVKPVEAEHPH
jgi:multidrug efflux pump